MNARIVSAAVFSVLACGGTAAAAECSHPKSIEILRDIGSRASIGKTLDILKKRQVTPMILYKADAGAAERYIPAEKLPSLKYHSVEVSLLSPFPGGFIVSYDEKLSLEFDSHGVLTGSSCNKVGTGP